MQRWLIFAQIMCYLQLDTLKMVMKSESTLLHFTFLTTSPLQSLLTILQISSPKGVTSVLSCDVNDIFSTYIVNFMPWHVSLIQHLFPNR